MTNPNNPDSPHLLPELVRQQNHDRARIKQLEAAHNRAVDLCNDRLTDGYEWPYDVLQALTLE